MEEISNFIKTIMEKDLEEGRVKQIVTRFPPEPNAYLHIGHARAIVNDFELAKCFGGYTNLRFDDTNPINEGAEYVDAIIADLKWLGYEPKNVYFGSDYFEKTYERAVLLIKKGLAYVDDLSPEEMTAYRGTLTEPGKESPCRNRSVEENLKLFEEMRAGKYANGEKTLRAKIDMAHPNINMRDPVMYRILHVAHHRQGTKWCIYPMYDFAHPLQDAFEGVTHSLCSLEYDNHRVLYDWFIEKCEMEHVPHQYEWGRLNITNTVMSKRYLRQLVEGGYVIPAGSFAKKLYSTFLSYLPASKVAFPLKRNVDARGSFTELLKTVNSGQFSVNVSLPGITKGQHWHNTKWEFFIVVSGHALIQERRIGSDEVLNFEVSGDEPQAVHMLPGYTHNIINRSDTEPLVTLMWANELFDPNRPDTYFEPVE